MPNINLLPEDLREKEAREIKKLAKKPRVFEIGLSQPKREQLSALKEIVPKKSFWPKFFKPEARPSPPKEQKFFKDNLPSVDLLSSARKQSREYYQSSVPPKGKKKSSSWFKIFGPSKISAKPWPEKEQNLLGQNQAVKPEKEKKPSLIKKGFWSSWRGAKKTKIATIKPMEMADDRALPSKAAKITIDFAKDRNGLKPERLTKTEFYKNGAADSWGKIISSMFGFHKKKTVLPAKIISAPDVTSGRQVSQKSAKPTKEKTEKEKLSATAKAKKSHFNINLIPEELVYREWINIRMQIIVLFLAIIFPAVIVYGAYRLIGFYQERADQQIHYKQAAINKLQEVAADYQKIKQNNTILQQKLMVIKGILDGHIYWTNFFRRLEKYTLDGVYYTDFAADISGEFMLPAIAASYGEAAKQIMAFKQAADFVKEVRVDKISLHSSGKGGITGVEFELKLKLADNVFRNIKK
ncbi:hypothetical protein HZA71_01325 [Candidatus Falkowbacteria bacterium]|nr:hypothetical protein [Candidatus Falkowbacteria bacterium]